MQLISALLVASASAFVLPAQQTTSSRMMSAATPPEPVAAPPPPPPPPKFDIKKLPGVTAPFGYFDPLGIAADKSEARVKYFRESELKHCRVAMLAAAGFLVAEVFHPLFGGNIDVPSYLAFQETPLQTFWPIVVLYIGVIEVFSVFTFESPFDGNLWTLKANRVPGDFEFDPLDLKPPGKADSFDMETKELNNGRLAMIAIAGMVAQEVIFKGKLF